jgi:putative oxidoreductase
MNFIRRIPYITDLGLLVARVALGVVFVGHGWQKVYGQGHTATAAAFRQMGVPLPEISAFYATWVELLGGAALIIGVAVPIAGLLLFADMAGAFLFVHAGHGMFLAGHGFEFVLVLGATSLLLAVLGSGRFGVDAFLGGRDRATHAPEGDPADR